jgi:prepilin-type N-terminal cleavage/methylation domain-containing protein
MRTSPVARGFTLIELMISVSIVMTLATLSFPNLEAALMRTRRSELAVHVDAIRTAEWAYHAEWDQFTSCALLPSTVPGRSAVPFPATEQTSLDWNMLGWVPDGKVYGQYRVVSNGAGAGAATFLVDGFSDTDGDGNLANVTADHLLKGTLITGSDVY